MLAPFALWPVLPAAMTGRHTRDYYEASAPPHGQQSATDLPLTGLAARRLGRPRAVPTFTMRSIGQGGTQLYSGSIATTTPQAFTVASPPTELDGFGVKVLDLPAADLTHCIAGSSEVLMGVFSGEVSLPEYLGAFLLPTTLGNTAGGLFLVALLNYGQVAGSRSGAKTSLSGYTAEDGQREDS